MGLDAARGDLIGFTDSDDAISPEFLEALLSLYAPGVLPVADIERSDGDGSVLASPSARDHAGSHAITGGLLLRHARTGDCLFLL